MRDTIRLVGVRARGHHGSSTTNVPTDQDFVVDVAVELDATAASDSDDLGETVHYGCSPSRVVPRSSATRSTSSRPSPSACRRRPHAPAALATEVTVHKPQAPITVPFTGRLHHIRRERTGTPAEEEE